MNTTDLSGVEREMAERYTARSKVLAGAGAAGYRSRITPADVATDYGLTHGMTADAGPRRPRPDRERLMTESQLRLRAELLAERKDQAMLEAMRASKLVTLAAAAYRRARAEIDDSETAEEARRSERIYYEQAVKTRSRPNAPTRRSSSSPASTWSRGGGQ